MALSGITIRWLLFATIIVATTAGDIDTKMDCGPDVLCEGKTPRNYPEQFRPTIYDMQRCYCDKDCIQFGDCCVDKAPYPNDINDTMTWSCVALSLNQSVYAVSNCIEKGNKWKDMCEKVTYLPKINYIVDIPIYSNLTGLYYANIFCAFCDPHFQPAIGPHLNRYFTVPNISISCTENITKELLQAIGVYINGTLTWKVGDGYCAYFQEQEDPLGRSCILSVSSCPPGADSEISAKCRAYSLLISVSDKVYRNPHCAVCNGAIKSDLYCKYHDENIVLPSLSVILNIDPEMYLCDFEGGVALQDSLHQKYTRVSCEHGKGCRINKCKTDSPCLFQNQLSLIIEGYLTYACLSVSIVCLLVHVCKSIFVTRPDHMPAKILNSLAWSLLIAQTFFLCGMYSLVLLPQGLCYLIAIVIQYFFLASFFWMSVISIDIWFIFSDSFKMISYTKYATYAWGGAAFFTGFSVTADLLGWVPERFRPHYAERRNICWFGTWNGLAMFFCFPVLLILLVNSALFVITIYKSRKQNKFVDVSGRKDYVTLLLYIKLSTIMGMTWALGLLLTSIVRTPDYHYPFTVLNGLQGAFIYIMFDLKINTFYIQMKLLLSRIFGKKTTVTLQIKDT